MTRRNPIQGIGVGSLVSLAGKPNPGSVVERYGDQYRVVWADGSESWHSKRELAEGSGGDE